MRYRYFIFLVVIGIFIACKKQGEIVAIPPQQDPPVPTVLMKDIIIPNLPSPYYHFEYNTKGKTVFASFASGFNMYNIVTAEKRSAR